LSGLGSSTASTRIVVIDLVNQMRCVFLGDTKGFTKHLRLLVHRYRLFWLLRSEEALLSLGKIILLLVRDRLLQLNTCHTLRMVLTSNLDGGVPVAFMLIHVNSLLWLISLNKLFFGLFEAIVVL